MTETTTITVRVPIEVKDKLDRLAHATRRSRSFHAAEALTAYASSELETVSGILQGLDDADAGHVVPHVEAMDQLRDRVTRVADRASKKSA